MINRFNKSLVLCIQKYSLNNALVEVLSSISDEVESYDVRNNIPHHLMRAHAQMYRFPNKIRSRWENYFLNKVNDELLKEIDRYSPDLVLVYNSEFLLPVTCEKIKRKSRLVFFMGDSPFYTPINNFYLASLSHADLILVPDTFWMKQLNTIGMNKTEFFMPGIESTSYHIIENRNELINVPETDVMYTGTCYVDSWGYKKALLMNQFTPFNFKLHGNKMWKRWFGFFPDLESHFTEGGYINTPLLNKMFNNTKIIPVDGNPGILNGFHLRLFEALGSGALPLIEYRHDVGNELFKGFGNELPIIYDYSKARELAKYYLNNESERKELVTGMRAFLNIEYNSSKNGEKLLAHIAKHTK